jgi:diguanylate cyclase
MTVLHSILLWVIASVMASLGIGYYLGLSRRRDREREALENERKTTLTVLSSLLTATERLKQDVTDRNSEIRLVEETISEMHLEGELGEVQQALLLQVTAVLEANSRLEDDLVYTRLQMREQAIEIDKERKESRTDCLSGVSNRKGFAEKMALMVAEARHEDHPLSLVLVDVDHFKWINDTHGHQAGDRVVAQVGKFFYDNLTEADFVARYGGDEFALLIPQRELSDAVAVCERIRVEITRVNFGTNAGQEVAVTFSIGVALLEVDEAAEDLFERADKALYGAKENGRNKVYVMENGELFPATVRPLLAAAD